jgi:hypothetical protein
VAVEMFPPVELDVGICEGRAHGNPFQVDPRALRLIVLVVDLETKDRYVLS